MQAFHYRPVLLLLIITMLPVLGVVRRADAKNHRDYGAELLRASAQGDFKRVKGLLEAGADPNAHDEYGMTALMKATERGHLRIIELLLNRGSAINAKNKIGDTAWIEAAGNKNTRVVEFLLRRGADVNARNENGDTALIKAAENKNTRVVEFLLKRGADVRQANCKGWTALMGAVSRGTIETATLLLDKGADPNAITTDNDSVLELAAFHDQTNFVKLLLDRGVDVFAQGSGVRALLSAAKNGSVDIAKALLDAGVDINFQNEMGWSALMFAAGADNLEMVQLLLERGADVNARSPKGYTALMHAASAGSFEIVKLLLEKGADANVKSLTGHTALRAAEILHERGIVELIRNAQRTHQINLPEPVDTLQRSQPADPPVSMYPDSPREVIIGFITEALNPGAIVVGEMIGCTEVRDVQRKFFPRNKKEIAHLRPNSQIASRSGYPLENCINVMSDYKIINSKQGRYSALVTVRYSRLGLLRICPLGYNVECLEVPRKYVTRGAKTAFDEPKSDHSGRGYGLFEITNDMVDQFYSLQKPGDSWRIVSRNDLFVSVESAIKILECTIRSEYANKLFNPTPEQMSKTKAAIKLLRGISPAGESAEEEEK